MNEMTVEGYDKEIKKLVSKRNKLGKSIDNDRFEQNKSLIGKCFISNIYSGDEGEYSRVIDVDEQGNLITNVVEFFSKEDCDWSIDFTDIRTYIDETILFDNVVEFKTNRNEVTFEAFKEKIKIALSKSLEDFFSIKNKKDNKGLM